MLYDYIYGECPLLIATIKQNAKILIFFYVTFV